MWFSKEFNCLIYQVADPAHVVASIAEARRLNGSLVAIPVSLFNLQLARVLGLPVPSVLDLFGYDWPIQPGHAPFPQQRVMAAFHVTHPRSFNLSQMRTGKTLSGLWAADFLMSQGVLQKACVISPLSTMERVWGSAIFKNFLGRRKYEILHGDGSKRLDRLSREADFYIVNHDGIKVGCKKDSRGRILLGPLAQELQQRQDINCFIVDEAGAFRNAASMRSRVLREIAREKTYLWPFTGTPTPRAPTDAYGLAKLLGTTTESFQSFRGRTMAQISQFKWVARLNAAEHVAKVLSPAVRFSREECINLPPPAEETRSVPLSAGQETAYKQLKKDLKLLLTNGKTVDVANEAGLRTKLLQIACGCVYGHDREVHHLDSAPRLDALMDLIDEAGDKILIFAPFTSVVNFVNFALLREYGEGSVGKVYGGTPVRQRNEIFRRFDEDRTMRMLVADPRAMAHGLDLSVANVVAWYAPIDDLEIYDQANARIDGVNQKAGMLVVRFASTPVEKEIYRRLSEKMSLQGAILQLVEDER